MAVDFMGYFAIPFLTLTLSRGTELFTTNFSSIRTASQRQGEFLIWSFLLLLYFSLCFLPFFLKRNCIPERSRRFLPALFLCSGLFLLTAVFTPYLPREEPVLSQIHVYASVWSAISFLLFLFCTCLILYFCREKEGRLLLCLLIGMASFCAASYLVTGIVNSAMETVYTLSCTVAAGRLHLFFSSFKGHSV